MNTKVLTLALIVGLSGHAIANLTDPPAVVAQSGAPLGTFEDGEWSVTLEYYSNALSYYGRNKRTGDELSLRGARVAGNAQRRLYIWNNNNYIYQVSWRPSDPQYIRLQVFTPAGKEILNRLLRQV